MKQKDLNNLIMVTVAILGSLLLVLEINNTSLGSASWQTISQEIGYITVALIFFAMAAWYVVRQR